MTASRKQPQGRPRRVKQAGASSARPKPSTDSKTSKQPVSISDITASLNAIDEEAAQVKPKPKKSRKVKKPLTKRQKITRRTLIIVAILVLLAGGFFAYRAISSGSRMFDGNIFGALQSKPLQTDEYGRSNVLVFGTSEDNEGHSGADLADSIILLSINQKTNEANMMSVPRDLWVDYTNPSCSVGSEGKINAVYMCATEAHNGDKDKASLDFARKTSEVIGTDVQYYARVNYSVVRDLVDALGGVEVMIDSDDPRGILDRNFDKNCPNGPYTCHFVKYENGPAYLDGEHALALSRARNAKGGYGLSGSNFDREKNQQAIIRAVQEKALTTGTLTNPAKVLGLIDSLGDNVKTNLQPSELQTVIRIARNVSPDEIISLDLRDANGNALVTTGNYMGQSIVQPVLGLKNYSGIQAFVAESFAPQPEPATTPTP